MQNITFPNVLVYLAQHASLPEIEQAITAATARRTSLRSAVATTLTVGRTVRMDRIATKYLNGLSGEITLVDGKHATVRLDAASTLRLRMARQRRFIVPQDATGFPVSGIPLVCLDPID